MNNKEVGVVIIGRNEGERLILCLESILKLQVPCIYVDSQSKDNSVAEAERRGVTTVVLDTSAPINASRARNTGFKALMAGNPDLEFVHFIDADCELDISWLEHAVNKLKASSEVAVVCGRLLEKYRNESIYMRLCAMDWYHPEGFVDSCGGIATYRREIFEVQKGFNAGLVSGEEPELCSRIRNAGKKILCINAEMGTHDSAMRHFSQWWNRCVKVGFGYANGAKWGGWQKQYRSSLVWGAVLPLVVVIGGIFISPYFIVLLGLYPLQVLKIYMSKLDVGSKSTYDKFLYALFCVIAKFPETIGVVKFLISCVQGQQQKIIEYKG
jgi:glycosyltransferase involved in cell wall biosynthesis|tara:strand:- start:74619 stop:75596 length:978 start_codon:yes stop_codon:yes gene_type:complete